MHALFYSLLFGDGGSDDDDEEQVAGDADEQVDAKAHAQHNAQHSHAATATAAQ